MSMWSLVDNIQNAVGDILPESLASQAKSPSNEEYVRLDVRGTTLTTKRSVLLGERGSIFEDILLSPPGDDGSYFIDLDWDLFTWVAQYLRDGPDLFVGPTDMPTALKLVNLCEELRLPGLAEVLMRREEFCSSANGAQIKVGDSPSSPAYTGVEAEHAYDAVTQVICAILDIPIVLVSSGTDEHQWFKSALGPDDEAPPQESSFLYFTLKPDSPSATLEPLIAEDAKIDARFCVNPLVTGEPWVRFYAGLPLVSSQGVRMGALCCMDTRPRKLTEAELQLITNFRQITAQAMEKKQLSLSEGEDLEESSRSLGEPLTTADVLLRQAVNQCTVLLWARWDSLEWPILYANTNFERLTGVSMMPPAKFPGKLATKGPPNFTDNLWDYLEIPFATGDAVMDVWCPVRGSLDNMLRCLRKPYSQQYLVIFAATRWSTTEAVTPLSGS
eukprot:TRINITY_DN8008_c0_g1_i4.p1 TRINITY_DN8008_c0_g1~~TRINITY_DN8008_c0_g1_i4.p1  ORF type:complete len:455 (-),score=72.52 TRINITY_DN8008_c0_g1_i4:952-2283(-)